MRRHFTPNPQHETVPKPEPFVPRIAGGASSYSAIGNQPRDFFVRLKAGGKFVEVEARSEFQARECIAKGTGHDVEKLEALTRSEYERQQQSIPRHKNQEPTEGNGDTMNKRNTLNKKSATRQTLFGSSYGAVVRRFGKDGLSFAHTVAVLEKHGIKYTEGSVRWYLSAGHLGKRGTPAVLTDAQKAEVRSLKPVEAKSEAKPTAKGKPSSKK